MSPSDEARKLLDLEAELARAFPQLPVDKVHAVVENAWMRYLHAPVREFIPLLVGREARGELRVLAP
jgi:hypothetical protein